MNSKLRLATCALLLLGLAACGGEESASPSAGAGGPPPGMPVEAEVVKPAPLSRELIAVGSLRSDESVTLSTEISGRVQRIALEEGRPVKAGAVLFELEDSIYRAELEQAKANLQLARSNHQRAQELFAKNLISAADRDTTAANLAVSEAAAQLAQARFDKTRITAPFSGIAGLRMVSVGDYLSAGQQLVNLEAMQRMKVDFRVSEAALPVLAVGQTLDIQVDAYPGQIFKGEVYAIDPRLSETSRSIALRAAVPNADGKLRPGLFARVKLNVAHNTEALLVAEQAIFPRGEQQFVYVIENGSAAIREVKIGQRIPGRAEIVEGIKAGDTVITAGLQKIGPGSPVMAVNLAPPPAAQDATPAGN